MTNLPSTVITLFRLIARSPSPPRPPPPPVAPLALPFRDRHARRWERRRRRPPPRAARAATTAHGRRPAPLGRVAAPQQIRCVR
eukprot:3363633-Prymnesium_polylepis.1